MSHARSARSGRRRGRPRPVHVRPLYVMVTSALKRSATCRRLPLVADAPDPGPFVDIWSTVPLAVLRQQPDRVRGVDGVQCADRDLRGVCGVPLRFVGRRVFIGTVLSTQMFPGILFLLPCSSSSSTSTSSSASLPVPDPDRLIVTYLTFALPFSIWMLASYFDGIPRDLDEAARVDGCRALGALFRVVLPAARPGVIAVAVYAFMTSWARSSSPRR